MAKTMRLALLFALSISLQACINVPSKTPEQTTTLALHQQHLSKVAQIQQFTLQGRIGVQAEGKGFSGGLSWQHSASKDDLALYSPLGGQVAVIQKTDEKVTLTDAKGNSISAADAQTLTQKTLGWQLPLAGLADWSLGRPTNSPVIASTWNELGQLSTLKQDGWEIEYQNYIVDQGYFLPSKIVLRNEKVHLKLLIEQRTNIAN